MPLTNIKRLTLSPQVMQAMKTTGPMTHLAAPAPAPMPKLATPPQLPAPPQQVAPAPLVRMTMKTPMAPVNLPTQAPTPAAFAVPSTPAQQASNAADPSSSMLAVNSSVAMTPTVQALASAPAPKTVSDALAVIASSAPSQLAASVAASSSSSPMVRQSGNRMVRGGTINAPSQKYANAPSNASNQQPSQRRAAQGSTSMSKQFTRLERRIYCPIVSAAAIAAAAAASITTRPQVNFQPDQLIVSPSVAPFFDITQFTVGIQPQQAASGLAPGDAFPAQNGPHFLFDACDTGTDIIFGVTNNDTVAHVFKAVLIGYQIEISG